MDINITGIDESTGALVFKEVGAALTRIADSMGRLAVAADEADYEKDGTVTLESLGPVDTVPCEESAGLEKSPVVETVPYTPPPECPPEVAAIMSLEGVDEPAPLLHVGGSAEENAERVDTATVPETIQLDSAGLPWDERIHAGTRTKVAAGTWKWKPKTDQATKDAVVAELRESYPAPAAPSSATDSQGYPVKNAEEVFGDTQATPEAAPPYNFVALLTEVRTAVNSGQVKQETMDQVLSVLFERYGVTGWTDLQPKPELIEPFRNDLNGILGPRA